MFRILRSGLPAMRMQVTKSRWTNKNIQKTRAFLPISLKPSPISNNAITWFSSDTTKSTKEKDPINENTEEKPTEEKSGQKSNEKFQKISMEARRIASDYATKDMPWYKKVKLPFIFGTFLIGVLGYYGYTEGIKFLDPNYEFIQKAEDCLSILSESEWNDLVTKPAVISSFPSPLIKEEENPTTITSINDSDDDITTELSSIKYLISPMPIPPILEQKPQPSEQQQQEGIPVILTVRSQFDTDNNKELFNKLCYLAFCYQPKINNKNEFEYKKSIAMLISILTIEEGDEDIRQYFLNLLSKKYIIDLVTTIEFYSNNPADPNDPIALYLMMILNAIIKQQSSNSKLNSNSITKRRNLIRLFQLTLSFLQYPILFEQWLSDTDMYSLIVPYLDIETIRLLKHFIVEETYDDEGNSINAGSGSIYQRILELIDMYVDKSITLEERLYYLQLKGEMLGQKQTVSEIPIYLSLNQIDKAYQSVLSMIPFECDDDEEEDGNRDSEDNGKDKAKLNVNNKESLVVEDGVKGKDNSNGDADDNEELKEKIWKKNYNFGRHELIAFFLLLKKLLQLEKFDVDVSHGDDRKISTVTASTSSSSSSVTGGEESKSNSTKEMSSNKETNLSRMDMIKTLTDICEHLLHVRMKILLDNRKENRKYSNKKLLKNDIDIEFLIWYYYQLSMIIEYENLKNEKNENSVTRWLFSSNNEPKIIQICKEARNCMPNSPTIHYALGRYYYQHGDYELALESLRLCAEKCNTIQPWLDVTKCYIHLLDYNQSLESINNAIYVSRIISKRNKIHAGIPENSLELTSKAYKLKGEILMKLDRYNDAIDVFIKGIDITEGNLLFHCIDMYWLKARCHCKLNQTMNEADSVISIIQLYSDIEILEKKGLKNLTNDKRKKLDYVKKYCVKLLQQASEIENKTQKTKADYELIEKLRKSLELYNGLDL